MTTYNNGPRGAPSSTRKLTSVRCFNCRRTEHFTQSCCDTVKRKWNMTTNKFLIEWEETTPKTVEKKTPYTSTPLTRLNNMILGDIDSDRKAKAIMVNREASEHVVNNVKLFETLTPSLEKYVELVDRTKVTAKGKGTVTVHIDGIRNTLRNVHYISTLKPNLMSCSTPDYEEGTTTMLEDRCTLLDRGAQNRALRRIPRRDLDGL